MYIHIYIYVYIYTYLPQTKDCNSKARPSSHLQKHEAPNPGLHIGETVDSNLSENLISLEPEPLHP